MKPLRLRVLFFTLLIGSASISRAQDQSTQYLQAGNGLFTQKNYDEAVRYYNAVLQIDARSWQAFQGLGNCYYAKGDKTKALSNYQMALNLNPNNAPLSSFVQNLRAQVDVTPTPTGNNPAIDAGVEDRTLARMDKHFEIDPLAGAAIGTSQQVGFLGLGGGLTGGLILDPNLSLIATVVYFSFSGETYSTTQSAGVASLEITVGAKYRFGNGAVRPYVIGNAGFSNLIASETDGGKTVSASQTDPMIEFGVGYEFPLGSDLNLFAQIQYAMVFVPGATVNSGNGDPAYTAPGTTVSYIPVEVGLNFNMN